MVAPAVVSDDRLVERAGPASGAAESTLSTTLCRRAIEVHEQLLRRSVTIEPDCGVGESYASGARALRARADAQPWPVPAAVVERAGELLRAAADAPNDEVDAWIEDLARAFLAVIDRRHRVDDRLASRARRAIDRYR